MEMATLSDLMVETLKDLYSAETQILKAGPKTAKAVSNPELREALEDHIAETQEQVRRLEQVLKMMAKSPKGKHCKGMEGLLAENKEMMGEDGEPSVIDAGLICGQQKVEHYEIAGYGTAVVFAKLLGNKEAAQLLAKTLDEEEKADKRLTQIAQKSVNRDALQ